MPRHCTACLVLMLSIGIAPTLWAQSPNSASRQQHAPFKPIRMAAAEGGEPAMAPAQSAEPALAPSESGEPALAPSEAGEPAMAPADKVAPAESTGINSFRDNLREYGVSGSLRGGLWSTNRRLDDDDNVGTAQAWIKIDKRINKNWGVFAEGYFGAEDVFSGARSTNRLREAYLDARYNDWDFRLGKQIIAWGRADRLNPTDNLTPRDFTLLVPEIDEDRFGSLGVRGTFNFGPGMSLIGVWLPDFEPNKFAVVAQPGIAISQNIPDSSRQWGIKLDQSGKAIDWSISLFDGFDLTPDIELVSATLTGMNLSLNHNRIKVIGFDAATSRGPYRFAFEAAYTRTDDPDGTRPWVKNPFFYGVFGIERTFGENLNIIVQTFYRHVFHWSNPEDIIDPIVRPVAIQQGLVNTQYDKETYGTSVRVGKKWFNDTLEGELAGALLFNRSGYLLRPKVSYAWSDELKLIAGYEYLGGSDATTYGRTRKNKGLFLEARYFF